jgi:hypothetical protein
VLKKILIAIVLVIVGFVVVVAMQPAEFKVTRSTTIGAAPAVVFAQVNDLHNWKNWSPWAKLDPAMKESFEGAPAGKGAISSWAGNDEVGAGRMTVTDSHNAELVRIKLDFLKPFEATNITEFSFKPEAAGTSVTWTMSTERNFVQKAFCLVMNGEKMVGADFEKGLAQMKSYAEAIAKN